MRPTNQKVFRSILVRSPNWIGDQILAYPFFHFLRKAYPRARIGVACAPWVESIQYRDLVDDVFVLPKPMDRTLPARWKALEEGARAIRAAGPWDWGISLPNSLSAAWLLFRAGVKLRRGFATDGRGFLLNDRVRWLPSSTEHRTQAYINLLPEESRPSRAAVEFWGMPAENELDEDVPGELREFGVATAWPETEVLTPPSGEYWVLAPGSNAESRRWPIENFTALARRVQAETGLPGVVVGGIAEMPLAESLCSDPTLKLTDLTGQGSVPALWKVFRGAKFSVCNDSGLAHVASLCGSPTVIVWGAGQPSRTRPIGPGKTRIVLNPIECWPCERNTCALPPGRKLECLRGIQAETVWKEIQSGLRTL